ncbi:hypothetical protein V5N11_033847 [Cardamine amara subsp. amara]|uniref:Uncharacterized protein n=1 Tax=Cardamine amara subsp. amara TaxID=228776 RepID=A0ABD1AY15_CARAN
MEEAGDSSNSGSPFEPRLPLRLFATNCYPRGGKLNIYSKANLIGIVAATLEGTYALETILNSQFGKLFKLPVARGHNSAKIIHGLICSATNHKQEKIDVVNVRWETSEILTARISHRFWPIVRSNSNEGEY